MIVRVTRNPAFRRRTAFTLLEVLVVVAILVILASVASIYVFKYLEESKHDKALMDMQALNTAYQGYVLKNGGLPPESIQQLAPYMTQGTNALIDPWGNPYQIRPMIGAEQEERVQFFTQAPDGRELAWPRQ